MTAHFPPQLFGFRQRRLHDEACRTLCFKFRRRDWSGRVAKHGGVLVRTVAARLAAAAPSFQAGELSHDPEVGLWVRIKHLFVAHRRGVQLGDRLRGRIDTAAGRRRAESPAQAWGDAPQESKGAARARDTKTHSGTPRDAIDASKPKRGDPPKHTRIVK